MSVTHAHRTRTAGPQAPGAAAAAPTAAPVRPAAVAGLLAPTLVVGAADDTAEHDADALADRALRRLTAVTAPPDDAEESHRHDPGCGHLRRSAAPSSAAAGAIGAAGGALDGATAALVEGRRGAGRTLPGSVRRQMEGAFGTGLGHVRIHDDPVAAGLNRQVSARAFTTGSDIFFGAGQFAPGTAEGDRVLAHELAHVIAEPGPQVHRLFGFGKKLTPAEQAEKERKKQEKADRKAEEARERAEAKARKQEKKATATAAKQTEKAERAGLEQSRTEGVAGRAAMHADAYGGGGAGAGQKVADLNLMFGDALRYEQFQVSDLAATHAGDPEWTDERIAAEAYRLTWLEGTFAETLKHVRPARETAAERLVRDVRQARTAASVRQTMTKQSQRGTLLEPAVEAVYETYVTHIDDAMTADPRLDAETAAAQAEAVVWATTVAKVRTKRPARGSALDRAAIEQARTRLRLRPPPQVDTRDGLDKAGDTVDGGAGYVDLGTQALGALSGAVGGLVKDPDKDEKDKQSTGDAVLGKLPGGELAQEISTVRKRVAKGQRLDSAVEQDDPTLKDNVMSGIGSALSMITGLKVATQSALKFARATRDAYRDPSPRKALAAAKAGVDGLRGLTSSARSTANLAKAISPSVTKSVEQVVPGFNIAIAALSIVSAAIDLADRAMRLDQTNTTIFEARARDKNATKADVMVYPMLGVAQRYTKQVEQASWSTGIAISELTTSIATVASGGGYGIPTAVQAGISLLDMLHSLGHFFADEVLVSIARTAEKESAVLHLEGGAEAELRKHPAMAVDGIIMRAARGDVVALAFLATYEVDGEPISAAMLAGLDVKDRDNPAPGNVGEEDTLFTVREAVLGDLGAEADPQHAFTKFKRQAGGLLGGIKDKLLGGIKDKWAATGDMAGKRNAMDRAASGGAKGSRGLGWRLKMMLRGGGKTTRSINKTGVNWSDSTGGVPTAGMAIVCGPHALPEEPTDAQLAAFLTGLESMSETEILAQTANPANDDAAQEFLLNVWSERMKEKERAGV